MGNVNLDMLSNCYNKPVRFYLPSSCPILPFKAGRLQEHRSIHVHKQQTSVSHQRPNMSVTCLKIFSPRHIQTTAYTESICSVDNPAHALLFLKLWTFRNCNTQANPWNRNV